MGEGGSNIVHTVYRGLFPTSLSLWSIAIPEATALVNFSRSVGRTIITTSLRASDAQAASFHFGDKYPILTGSYSVGTSVGAQYVPPPSFTFEDLGVTVKVTPHIHGMGNVTLDLESEFKILSGASANGNPIISARQLKSSVDLREQEWAVIAGLAMSSDSRISTGTWAFPGFP